MEIEKYYEIFKGLMPYADKFLPSEHPLNENLKDVQKILNLVENMGGIKNITKFLNLNQSSKEKTTEQSVISRKNNSLPALDTLPKITNLNE